MLPPENLIELIVRLKQNPDKAIAGGTVGVDSASDTALFQRDQFIPRGAAPLNDPRVPQVAGHIELILGIAAATPFSCARRAPVAGLPDPMVALIEPADARMIIDVFVIVIT
jgi:hypothetical protein